MTLAQFERLPSSVKDVLIPILLSMLEKNVHTKTNVINTITNAFRTQLWILIKENDYFPKIKLIKLIRSFTDLGLKESKELVDENFAWASDNVQGDVCVKLDVERLVEIVKSNLMFADHLSF